MLQYIEHLYRAEIYIMIDYVNVQGQLTQTITHTHTYMHARMHAHTLSHIRAQYTEQLLKIEQGI